MLRTADARDFVVRIPQQRCPGFVDHRPVVHGAAVESPTTPAKPASATAICAAVLRASLGSIVTDHPTIDQTLPVVNFKLLARPGSVPQPFLFS